MSTDDTPAPENAYTAWDRVVRKSMDDFKADGSTILIKIVVGEKDTVFRVCRTLLSRWSPVFRAMFEDVNANSDTVEVHNNPDDFANFLWFIHVDPLSYEEYTSKCPKAGRLRRGLAVASIAHFYEATEIVQWGIKEILAFMEEGSGPEFLSKLHRLGELCREINSDLANKSRDAWKRMISSSSDPVAALVAAKSVHDEYLQAYAYFHILKKTTGQIADDTRLNALDRFRLMAGSLNLRRYEVPVPAYCNYSCWEWQSYSRCGHVPALSQGTTDEYQWAPKTTAPLQDEYGTHTLWDLFTRSPLGLKLSDGLDASHFALPNRGANVA